MKYAEKLEFGSLEKNKTGIAVYKKHIGNSQKMSTNCMNQP